MTTPFPSSDTNKPFRLLCLDGGGAKGVYSLGFLRELEAVVKVPLAQFFDAIYGTSTGAIIAALLGLGYRADEVLNLYLQHVPSILKPFWPPARSRALAAVGDRLFGTQTFGDFQTHVGIVATNWNDERPLIFKTDLQAAHQLKETFLPGFGVTISQAVQASCSASPFFSACHLDLLNVGKVQARDGGFAANNPSLFALTDALGPVGCQRSQIRLLSLGVGHYPSPRLPLHWRLLNYLPAPHLLQKTLSTNANTTEKLVDLLFPDIAHIRVSDRFTEPHLATDFLEHRHTKLDHLIQKGRESFSNHETAVRNLLENHGQN